jgi:hypothetical protein
MKIHSAVLELFQRVDRRSDTERSKCKLALCKVASVPEMDWNVHNAPAVHRLYAAQAWDPSA